MTSFVTYNKPFTFNHHHRRRRRKFISFLCVFSFRSICSLLWKSSTLWKRHFLGTEQRARIFQDVLRHTTAAKNAEKHFFFTFSRRMGERINMLIVSGFIYTIHNLSEFTVLMAFGDSLASIDT